MYCTVPDQTPCTLFNLLNQLQTGLSSDNVLTMFYEQGRTQDLSRGGQDFLGTKKLIIRNKIKGLGQGFRYNKKIVQELGTKLKD